MKFDSYLKRLSALENALFEDDSGIRIINILFKIIRFEHEGKNYQLEDFGAEDRDFLRAMQKHPPGERNGAIAIYVYDCIKRLEV